MTKQKKSLLIFFIILVLILIVSMFFALQKQFPISRGSYVSMESVNLSDEVSVNQFVFNIKTEDNTYNIWANNLIIDAGHYTYSETDGYDFQGEVAKLNVIEYAGNEFTIEFLNLDEKIEIELKKGSNGLVEFADENLAEEEIAQRTQEIREQFNN